MELIFETVKAKVSVPEAALFYGMNTERARMASCIFHEDRHPSMRLYEDHYYCFSCHAHGDVTDLVAALLHLSPIQTVRKIADDFGLSVPGKQDVSKGQEACEGPSGAERNAALADRRYYMGRERELREHLRIVSDYDRLLRDWKEKYAPVHPDDDLHWRFRCACRELPGVENLLDSLSSADPEEREWADQELCAGRELAKMIFIRNVYRKEEKANGTVQTAAGSEFPGMEHAAE